MGKNKTNTINIIYALVGFLCFIVFFMGILSMLIFTPFVLYGIGERGYSLEIVYWAVGVVIIIASVKLGAKFIRMSKLIKTTAKTDSLTIEKPWLIYNEEAVQYNQFILNPTRGLEFRGDINGKNTLFKFEDIKLRHSYNLRLPVIYLQTMNGQKYTIAFVVHADDVKNIQRNLVAVAALGEAGALVNTKTAIRSSYRQITVNGDSVEQIYRWFKIHRKGVYSNRLSRNTLMLIILISFFPVFITTAIVLENIIKH